MHPNCSRCRLPRRDCTCIYYRPTSAAGESALLHIGGTWSPSQHSAKEAK